MVQKQLYSLFDNFPSPNITPCHAMRLYNADTVPVGLLNGKHAKITQQQLRKISKGLCLVAELNFSSDNFQQQECRKRTFSVKTLSKVQAHPAMLRIQSLFCKINGDITADMEADRDRLIIWKSENIFCMYCSILHLQSAAGRRGKEGKEEWNRNEEKTFCCFLNLS